MRSWWVMTDTAGLYLLVCETSADRAVLQHCQAVGSQAAGADFRANANGTFALVVCVAVGMAGQMPQ